MFYLLDTNVLVYAKMEGMPEHTKVSRWLSAAAADPNSDIILCETSILAFLRISTNEKLFDPPLDLNDAKDFLQHFLSLPNVGLFQPTPQHFSDVASLATDHDMSGRHMMDAHLAALALNTGAALVTRDKDFRRIPYLTIVDPLAI
jgi:toxin-antitoxin system PIN domain toxin